MSSALCCAARVCPRVNHAEVITKLIDNGMRPAMHGRQPGERLGYQSSMLDEDAAHRGGLLRSPRAVPAVSSATGSASLLARELGLPMLTADRRWATLDLGVEVRLIR